MPAIRAALAAFAVGFIMCGAGGAQGSGRPGPTPPSLYAPGWRDGAPAVAGRAAWRVSSALVAEAERYLGFGKFTPLPGAWCADAVSAWLKAIGKPPLPNRLAASALAYGPHVADPRPGDLVVMRTSRGYAGHVAIVEAVNVDGSITIISGNWGRRVARGVIRRDDVTAFVRS